MSSSRPPSGPRDPLGPTETDPDGSPHHWPEPGQLSLHDMGRELRSWIDQEQATFGGDIPSSALRSYLQDRTEPDSKLLPALLHTVEQPLFRSLLRTHDSRSKSQIIKGLIDQQRDLYNQASINGISDFLAGFVDVAIIEPPPEPPPPPPPPPPEPPLWERLLEWLRSRGQGQRADGKGGEAHHIRIGEPPSPPRRNARTALLLGGGFFVLTTLILAVDAQRLNEQKRDLSRKTLLLRQNLDATCESFSLYLIDNALAPDPGEEKGKKILETLDNQKDNCNKSARYHGALGRSYYVLGQWQQAAEAFSSAIKLTPKDGWSHFQLGRAQYAQSMNSEALNSFDKAISLGLDRDAVFFSRGLANKQLGNTQAACSDFRQAIVKGYDARLAQAQMLSLPGCIVFPYLPAVQFPLGNAPSR